MVPTTAWEISEFLDDKVLRKRLEFHARINEGEDWAISEKVLEDLPTVVIADGRLRHRSNKKPPKWLMPLRRFVFPLRRDRESIVACDRRGLRRSVSGGLGDLLDDRTLDGLLNGLLHGSLLDGLLDGLLGSLLDHSLLHRLLDGSLRSFLLGHFPNLRKENLRSIIPSLKQLSGVSEQDPETHPTGSNASRRNPSGDITTDSIGNTINIGISCTKAFQ